MRYIWTGNDWQLTTSETKAARRAKPKTALKPGEHWVTMNGLHVLMDGDGQPTDPGMRGRLAVARDKMTAPTGDVPDAAQRYYQAWEASIGQEGATPLDASAVVAADDKVKRDARQANAYVLDYISTGGLRAPQSDLAATRLAKETDLDPDGVQGVLDAWTAVGWPSAEGVSLSAAAMTEFGAARSRYFVSALGALPLAPDADARRLTRQMYADTQAQLAKLPGDTVTLYRGIRVNHGPKGASLAHSYEPGSTVAFDSLTCPLSSWSADPQTAERFGNMVVRATVPKSRILSTWQTGLGSKSEFEVVVLGAKGDQGQVWRNNQYQYLPKTKRGQKAAPLSGGRWVTLRSGQRVYIRPKAGREAIQAGPTQAVAVPAGVDAETDRYDVAESIAIAEWDAQPVQAEAVHRFAVGDETAMRQSWAQARAVWRKRALRDSLVTAAAPNVWPDELASDVGVDAKGTYAAFYAWNRGDTFGNQGAMTAFQVAAVEEFGGMLHPRMADRWRSIVGERTREAEDAHYAEDYPDIDMPSRLQTAFDTRSPRRIAQASGSATPDLSSERKLLRGMYNRTQAALAAIPGDTITLYRGVDTSVVSGANPPSRKRSWGKPARLNRIDAPLTSWSLDPITASDFNTAVLVAKVPKSRILSTWRTGFGVGMEGEVIVLGGNPADQALYVF